METVKKTRGRKKKEISIIIESVEIKEPDVKRRGRKPKGGKLIQKSVSNIDDQAQVSNVILHLKCSLRDLYEYTEKQNETIIAKNPLEYNPSVPPEIMAYDSSTSPYFSMYQKNAEVEKTVAYVENQNSVTCITCKNAMKSIVANDVDEQLETDENDSTNIKDLNTKLKKMRIQFYKNTLVEKKSACFWCTYEFDNPSCFIPKYQINDEIVGYGSFCRPECAVGYLMRENIDDSSKFERYYLLNQIYSKVCGFRKNIKPAPDPHFMLDKFYGNLSIKEYRHLLKTDNILTIMEKPMTRILPEMHEDNDEFLLNVYGGIKPPTVGNSNGIYKVKRQSEKQNVPSKLSIMRDKFGM